MSNHRIGIVGAEASKFTTAGAQQAKALIRSLLTSSPDLIVVSGHCHLGGVDIWAEEIADELGLTKAIFPPAELNWHKGYKPRNLKIATFSDIVHCIAVDQLPSNFSGMKFSHCYHCPADTAPHVKSGGCWTMRRAKQGQLHVVSN